MITIEDIENTVGLLVNEFKYGYAYIKNTRLLLDQLTEYKAEYKIEVKLNTMTVTHL